MLFLWKPGRKISAETFEPLLVFPPKTLQIRPRPETPTTIDTPSAEIEKIVLPLLVLSPPQTPPKHLKFLSNRRTRLEWKPRFLAFFPPGLFFFIMLLPVVLSCGPQACFAGVRQLRR